MTALGELLFALRLLRRDWRAGELRVLAAALVIAVASVTTVAFFSDRVRDVLVARANHLLGGDLVLVSSRPIPDSFRQQALSLGLDAVQLWSFPSMATAAERSLLSDVRAIEPGYPLRGELRVAAASGGPGEPRRDAPFPGDVWVDDRFLARLGVEPGDRIGLGDREFRIAGVIVKEPESAVGFANLGPRLMLNAADLPSTGLIQPGSRIRYRLVLAGEPGLVEAYRQAAQPQLVTGQRLEGIRDARPEISSGLDRAERFLALAALASVILAAVAVALAARRYLQRHFDACAVMRCLGARQATIVRVYAWLFLALGLVASTAGTVAGLGAQEGLARVLAPLVGGALPPPGWLPAARGFVAGFVLLLGFAMPPIAALGRVPTLRVLRRDLGAPGGLGTMGYVAGIAAISGLVLWTAGDLRLGLIVLLGVAAALLAAGALSFLLLQLVGRVAGRATGAWRIGLANLRRRAAGTTIQVAALAMGLMAMLLLTLVRGELLENWRTSLPPDAPNRFLVNIQADQREPLERFFQERGIAAPRTFPMVRARLTAINDRPVSSEDYADDRAKRLIDREFNLSWTEKLSPDNRLVAGSWWPRGAPATEVFSVERGIAQTLGIRLGDTLTYDIAGARVKGKVTSLRHVDWDTFRVNFFVVAPPGFLEPYPANFVTSFYLPPERNGLMNDLVKAFPNLLVIDVAAVLAQVQTIMDQVIRAVEFVFGFTLLAGLLVLYAAIAATRDERLLDAAIMRTLGASTRQLAQTQAVEFVAIGAMAGLVAAAGATGVGWAIAQRILNIPFHGDPWLWVIGVASGAIGVAAAGWLGTRRLIRRPPLRILSAT
ncbi:MAG: ABC transporter permease [Pseudomonadota bacterium]